MTNPKHSNPSDQYNDICHHYFEIFFQERMLDSLIRKWSHIDLTIRYLIAATASGSVVSGWTIWDIPEGRIIWEIFSGITALLAIGYNVIGISSLLNTANKSYANTANLRIQFEKFIREFKRNIDSISDDTFIKLDELLDEKYRVFESSPRFNFVSNKFSEKVQDDLEISLYSKGFIDNPRTKIKKGKNDEKTR